MDWQTADLPGEFERFQQYCLLVFQGPFSDKSDKEKVAYVMLWIGRAGADAFNSFEWDNASDKSKVAAVFKKFNKHLQPRRVNAQLARFGLQKYRQQPDKSVDDFFARCKKKTSKCKFRDAQETNDRLIEQLIVGTKHSKVQECLLEGGSDLTLDEALDKARTYEATQRHMEQLSTATSSRLPETVHAISKSVGHADCGKCGRTHHPSKCPAHDSTCNKCGKANHWANVCRSQGRDEAHGRGQQRGRWRQRSPI